MPRPPNHAGRAKRSRSSSFKAFCPVRAEMNLSLIVSSRGLSILTISGMVLLIKVYLL